MCSFCLHTILYTANKIYEETEEKIESQTEKEVDESEDSENNRKKVRYEDGTWKFF